MFYECFPKLFLIARSAQEKLAGIQGKLQNKNLSNKRRKELKKSKSKIAGEERRRASKETEDDAQLVITSIQTLTIWIYRMKTKELLINQPNDQSHLIFKSKSQNYVKCV